MTSLISSEALRELIYKASCWDAYQAGEYQAVFYLSLWLTLAAAAILVLALLLRQERRDAVTKRAEVIFLDAENKVLHRKIDEAEAHISNMEALELKASAGRN